MYHLSDVRIIPSAEGDARDKILVVNQSKCSRGQKTAVIVAKIVQPNSRLTECVNTADGADDFVREKREARAGELGESPAEAVAGDPQSAFGVDRAGIHGQRYRRDC